MAHTIFATGLRYSRTEDHHPQREATMASGLTAEELIALPDGSIVELRDHLGRTYAAAQRLGLHASTGYSPRPKDPRGWVLTEYLEDSDSLATRICDESFRTHRIVELNGGERVLMDFQRYSDYLGDDYRAAGEQLIEELKDLPEYSLIGLRDGEILGMKLDSGEWATSDHSWIDDEETLETEFIHADSIWELSSGKPVEEMNR